MMLSSTRTKPMEILLVEDGLTDARVTIHALRRTQIHHRLTLVRTVKEALMFLRCDGVFRLAPHPDLLLLDINLPDGSGIDILEAIMGMGPEISSMTVVVLTASDDEGIRRRCSELEVHDYIKKPVREDEFMRVMREHKQWLIDSTPMLAGAMG
jgi:CheY-like chemotaxis protein